jgi:hypothetical protein
MIYIVEKNAPMALSNNYSLTHQLSLSCLYPPPFFFNKVSMYPIQHLSFSDTMSFPTLELTATNMYFGSGIKLSHIRYFLSCFYISTSNTIETQRKLIKWFRNSTFIAFFMIWYVMKGGTVSSIYFLFCVNSLFINMFDTIHSYINFCICMYMYMYI